MDGHIAIRRGERGQILGHLGGTDRLPTAEELLHLCVLAAEGTRWRDFGEVRAIYLRCCASLPAHAGPGEGGWAGLGPAEAEALATGLLRAATLAGPSLGPVGRRRADRFLLRVATRRGEGDG